MSVHKSYFSKNNTIIYNSYTNTGRNPVTQLYFGPTIDTFTSTSYSRFIFDLDLTDLITKYNDGTISTDCNGQITHTLKMTNTSSFDEELLNTKDSEGVKRATSFDLVLFRIPTTYDENNDIVNWDEGVGYDYYPTNKTSNTPVGMLTPSEEINDKAFSERPSNWYNLTTVTPWVTPGIYDNSNSASGNGINYSAITIVDTQHFQFGNEDIEFDMTSEINYILNGGQISGWGIAFLPQLETLTGLTENYVVGFFTRHTQTFYEPFLETSYTDLIGDDRNSFYGNTTNNLYLYSYINGNFTNLDNNPTVDIIDNSGSLIYQDLETCLVTKGIYKVEVPAISITNPCTYNDVWKNLEYNNNALSNITNDFIALPFSQSFQLGIQTKEPKLYGFEFYGIKQDEKILNTDIRKVGVVIKKAYSTNEVLQNVESYYRIYVREGQTEVQVQDWTQINRTPNEYYFIFDTRDKIPNEYFVDIKVLTSGEVNTYKRTLKFQIVNKK
jgi:hypothetical protein